MSKSHCEQNRSLTAPILPIKHLQLFSMQQFFGVCLFVLNCRYCYWVQVPKVDSVLFTAWAHMLLGRKNFPQCSSEPHQVLLGLPDTELHQLKPSPTLPQCAQRKDVLPMAVPTWDSAGLRWIFFPSAHRLHKPCPSLSNPQSLKSSHKRKRPGNSLLLSLNIPSKRR